MKPLLPLSRRWARVAEWRERRYQRIEVPPDQGRARLKAIKKWEQADAMVWATSPPVETYRDRS